MDDEPGLRGVLLLVVVQKGRTERFSRRRFPPNCWVGPVSSTPFRRRRQRFPNVAANRLSHQGGLDPERSAHPPAET